MTPDPTPAATPTPTAEDMQRVLAFLGERTRPSAFSLFETTFDDLCALLAAARSADRALQAADADHIRDLQAEIAEAHKTLTDAGVPTNGEDGVGKRQSLTLAQRISRIGKADADKAIAAQ